MTSTDLIADRDVNADVLAAGRDLVALVAHEDIGRFALTLSGSISKRTADHLSDVDFRFYSDRLPDVESETWESRWNDLRRVWADRGILLDELWFRTVDDVDADVDAWLAGTARADDLLWTVWGYHPLTDLRHQVAVIDEHELAERWRRRLIPYPAGLRRHELERHLSKLRYWRQDYHYENKARRGDEVFLAGLTAALVHHMVAALAALNEIYFPGDGNNLVVTARMPVRPSGFEARVTRIMTPDDPRDHVGRRHEVVALIDEVDELVTRALNDTERSGR